MLYCIVFNDIYRKHLWLFIKFAFLIKMDFTRNVESITLGFRGVDVSLRLLSFFYAITVLDIKFIK